MGKIQRCSKDAQVDFMWLCCTYWDAECQLSIESVRQGIDHLDELLRRGVVKESDGMVQIDFLDEQMNQCLESKEKYSQMGKSSAEKRIQRRFNVGSTHVQPAFNVGSTDIKIEDSKIEDREILDKKDSREEKADFLQNRPRSKKVDVELSEESNQFVGWWIKNYSPPHIKVSDQMISDWRKVWDKLRAEYEKEVLKVVIDFTMKDEFWAKNLQTPLKLSKKNKDGIRYIDQFITNYRIKNRAAIIDQQTDWNGFVNDIIKQNA